MKALNNWCLGLLCALILIPSSFSSAKEAKKTRAEKRVIFRDQARNYHLDISFNSKFNTSLNEETDSLPDTSFGNVGVNAGTYGSPLEIFNKFKSQMGFDWTSIRKFGLLIEFTSSPLDKELTSEEGAKQIDLTLEKIKQQAVIDAVNLELASNPAFTILAPGPQKDAFRETVIEATSSALDQHFRDIAFQQKEQMNDRLDDFEVETFFQKGAVYFVLGNTPNVLSWLELGMSRVHAGALVDQYGQTKVEQFLPVNSRVSRSNDTNGTSALKWHTWYNINKSKQQLFYVMMAAFHNRAPLVTSGEYLGNVLTMEQDKYDKHQDLSRIDSGLVRFGYIDPLNEMTVSAGVYDSDLAVSATYWHLFKNGLELAIEGALSERDNLKKAFGVHLAKKVVYRNKHLLKFFVGGEYAEGIFNSLRDVNEYDSFLVRTGMTWYDVLPFFNSFITMDNVISLEYERFFNDSLSYNSEFRLINGIAIHFRKGFFKKK